MSDLMYRATTKAAWDAFASEMGLTYDTALIDEIGPIVTTPAILDEDGEIVTPAVMDDSHHVNVRVIHLPQSVDEEGEITVITMADLADGNADVEWVHPATVDNPRRIWAGGMRYWTAEDVE
jgi:hypothetical protein